MSAKSVIAKFGGQSALAGLLGVGQSTVAYWAKTGVIPMRWHAKLLRLAAENSVELLNVELMAAIKSEQAGHIAKKDNDLVSIMPRKVAADPRQRSLDLGIEKQIEIDGVGMGVLSDGTPFLTLRGLARLCGVSHSVIQGINEEWDAFVSLPRATRIREILASHGERSLDAPYIAINQRSGTFYAYPDSVCLAILEYYSFDAGANIREEAKRNYRILAGKALREFIYTQVGYDPSALVPDAWKIFHDRVSLTYNSVPRGYFGIFKEMADMIVTLGQAGLHIDSSFVPDISVGIAWAKHWNAKNLDEKYGERIKFEHNYPTYFPQAKSNPQEPWCYPEDSLGEFRRWLRDDYIGEGKFKTYLEGKVKEKALPISFAQLAISAYGIEQ